MQDTWAGRRKHFEDALARSLDGIEFSSAELLREQLQASDPTGYEAAALACLGAAEAAGGASEAAMPGAVAIAFLAQMALVFTGLEIEVSSPSSRKEAPAVRSASGGGLSAAWGVPRSLNAGDAMFAMAQESLLSARDELTAADRLHATGILDRGGRALVEALFAAGAGADPVAIGQRALLPAAIALGGLLGGADAATRARLSQLGSEWSSLSVEELARRLESDPGGWLAR